MPGTKHHVYVATGDSDWNKRLQRDLKPFLGEVKIISPGMADKIVEEGDVVITNHWNGFGKIVEAAGAHKASILGLTRESGKLRCQGPVRESLNREESQSIPNIVRAANQLIGRG